MDGGLRDDTPGPDWSASARGVVCLADPMRPPSIVDLTFALLGLTGIAARSIPPVAFQGCCGLGFDFGTSGVRITVLDEKRERVFEAAQPWSPPGAVEDANAWKEAMWELLSTIPSDVRGRIQGIAFSGTSASCVVVGRHDGRVRRQARLYNWDALRERPKEGKDAREILAKYAPPLHTTLSGTSTMLKVLTWALEQPFEKDEVLSHQADFLAGHLMHEEARPFPRISDWNNALKLGFDVADLRYPQWFEPLGIAVGASFSTLLPEKVVEPGAAMGRVSRSVCDRFGLPHNCTVAGGTTDSIAAFIASGASKPGQAVSSLGSTLALKLLSTTPVEDANRGVYSHRLGDLWLVGGASNVGCAVLRELGFSNEELERLSLDIDPDSDSPLRYYPLAGKGGERFPTCDPDKKAMLEPRPESRRDFLHGVLQGIAEVEVQGYGVLRELGATPLTQVLSAGGGANNPMWTKMRQRLLGVPTSRAANSDAAYGAALLALKLLSSSQPPPPSA